MARWVWAVIVAGCSDPGGKSPDAAVLPDAFADMDMDGIADAIDLCPTLAAGDNGDQDSDLLGDPCDPCPYLSANVDTDGDGVGDLCDPHPTQAIDRRVAFYGFYASTDIAAWQKTGTWSVSGGKLTTYAVNSAAATIVSPDMFGPDIVITASVNVQSLNTSQTLHRTASILQLRGTTPVMSHKCGLDQIAATAVVNYQIVNTTTMVGNSQTIAYPEPVVALHEYKLGFAGATGTCGVDGPPRTFTQSSGAAGSGPVGINAEYSQIAIDYMFVVASN